MSDARSSTDSAIQHLDRLSAAILDDVGEGPSPETFASIVADVASGVATIGVPAFNELAGLLVGVSASIAGKAVDWSPALGGTLMAAVDDLRAMVGRAAHFSPEDSEHLHQRVLELAPYVKVAARASNSSASAAAVTPSVTPVVTPSVAPIVTPSVTPSAPASAAVTSSDESPAKKPDPVIPISDLFYAEGPGIVKGGVPKNAEALSDLLGAGVEALEKNLIDIPLAAAASSGPMQIVPVDTLIYKGRAALERAVELRDRIRSSGNNAAPATLDELYDLVGLALKE